MSRYDRQIKLSEWGGEAQSRLEASSVLVIGAGGLGCSVLLDLCGAGVGTIGLIEGDLVSWSNLHRQGLYKEKHVGQPKLYAALEELRERNSETEWMGWEQYLDADLALDVFPHFDLVIDCTDNFASRYLIGDVCQLYAKVWISGSVHRNQYQLCTYGWHGKGSFRKLFPEKSERWLEQDCGEAGVLGPVVALAAHEMSLEAMWILGKDKSLLSGSLQLLDPIRKERHKFSWDQDGDPITAEEIRGRDYQISYACRMGNTSDILLDTWRSMYPEGKQLNIGASEDIEAGDLRLELSGLEDWVPEEGSDYLIYCERGKTSLRALAYLREKFPGNGWYNLKGGINAIQDE